MDTTLKLNDSQRAANVKLWLTSLLERDPIYPDLLPRFKKGIRVLRRELTKEYCCLGVACEVLPEYLAFEGDKNNYERFPEVLGLRDAMGALPEGMYIEDQHTLVKLNDNAFIDDKDFTRIHHTILTNIDNFFIPEVAAILHETMKEEIASAVDVEKLRQRLAKRKE